jgi:hypothetical protein
MSVAFICIAAVSNAQTINWRSMQDDKKHVVSIHSGWDYGTAVGFSYGYKLNFRIPMIAGLEYSMPTGRNIFDDLKTKAGVQAEIFRYRSFSASLRANGIFRRYESELVRFANFGSEFAAVVGYLKPRWYAAAEFGFDKSIITHIKHSTLMEEYNPGVQSGWYIPTGGNFFYGIQMGYSFRTFDVFLKGGKTVSQDLDSKAQVPFYFQMGMNKKF